MSARRMMQAAPKVRHRPAFTIEKLDGEYEVTQYEKTDMGLVQKKVKRPRGYLVTFLKGHSIHVATDEELQRLGLNDVVPMIDTVQNEAVPGYELPVEAVMRTPGRAATQSS